MAVRSAFARWEGSLPEGSGTMRLAGGAFEGPYSAQSRFEEGAGTNPEELIAAAHAGCFSMALTAALGRAGFSPQSVETVAKVQLLKRDEGFRITRIDLEATASVPGIEVAKFQEIAEGAKAGCPVSVALGGVPEIALDARLA
ncbi:MAG: OsmC family peroxiredoxin [Acidimicrobiia bacterium]|nr:OsmC family peroxiredoxin [Acidimicrobiia bacterium]